MNFKSKCENQQKSSLFFLTSVKTREMNQSEN